MSPGMSPGPRHSHRADHFQPRRNSRDAQPSWGPILLGHLFDATEPSSSLWYHGPLTLKAYSRLTSPLVPGPPGKEMHLPNRGREFHRFPFPIPLSWVVRSSQVHPPCPQALTGPRKMVHLMEEVMGTWFSAGGVGLLSDIGCVTHSSALSVPQAYVPALEKTLRVAFLDILSLGPLTHFQKFFSSIFDSISHIHTNPFEPCFRTRCLADSAPQSLGQCHMYSLN